MRWLVDMRIRAKLALITVFTSAIALVLAGAIIIAYDNYAYRAQKTGEISAQAGILAASVIASLEFNDPKAAQEYLNSLEANPGITAASVYASNGSLFATYSRAGIRPPPPSAEAQVQRFEGNEFVVFWPVQQGQRLVGTIYLRASIESLGGRVTRFGGIILLVMIGSLLITLPIAMRLHSVIANPLRDIAEAASRIADGDLNVRVDSVPRADEIGVLMNTFGRMVESLREMTRRVAERTQQVEENTAKLAAEIVERKRAEEEIKFKNTILQTQQDTSLDAILVVDENRQIISYNQQFIDLWRLSPQLVNVHLDAPVLQSVVDQIENSEAFVTQDQYLYAHRDEKSREEVPLKDGRIIDRYSAPVTGADGKYYGRVWYFRDITERKQAADEISRLNVDLEQRVAERTTELTAANRELDTFAYAVAHDLRAPLRAMIGFSQALQEDYSGQLQGEAMFYLEQIGLASRKMSDLIDGLLTLSRSTRGGLQYDSVDISALSKRLLVELAQSDPERQVTVEVEAGLQARGDARMIEVIMRNLLGNAWKYTARAAEPNIRMYAEERDNTRAFCIADNGAGFDVAHVNRLFKPFQRLHRQDEFPGIGIGLATVQRIVNRHGGTIEARGEPGKGAIFCFTLSDTPADSAHSEKET